MRVAAKSDWTTSLCSSKPCVDREPQEYPSKNSPLRKDLGYTFGPLVAFTKCLATHHWVATEEAPGAAPVRGAVPIDNQL